MELGLNELREKNHLRLVTNEEEGTGVNRLPSGVYGFSYAPASKEAPLFCLKRLYNFEVQKLSDGAVHIVGYVDGETAQLVREGKNSITFRLHPDPSGDSVTLVSIPTWRITRSKEHSIRDGMGLEIEIGGLE